MASGMIFESIHENTKIDLKLLLLLINNYRCGTRFFFW